MAFQRTPLKEPSFRVNSREAFIKKHPTSIYTLNSNEQVTIGDMHGNTLKFIYFLIKFNVIDMEASDYIKIDAIYNKEVNELTKEDSLHLMLMSFLQHTLVHKRVVS